MSYSKKYSNDIHNNYNFENVLIKYNSKKLTNNIRNNYNFENILIMY